jgi:hypothetical protein
MELPKQYRQDVALFALKQLQAEFEHLPGLMEKEDEDEDEG